jgi:prepilin-type N-terminal cleavage/methylation domain-containing protein
MKTKYSRRSGLSLLEVVIAMAILSAVMFMAYSVLFSTSTTAARGEMTAALEARGKKVVEFCKSDFYDARFNDTDNGGNLSLGIHDNHTQVHYQRAIRLNPVGSVDYGYLGRELLLDPVNFGKNWNNYYKVKPQTAGVDDPYLPFVGCSCVLRFEPELALYEGTSATPPVLMPPYSEDKWSPQFWNGNIYNDAGNGAPLKPGAALPVKVLNRDIDGDNLKTGIFVKGKIVKYVMLPVTPGATAVWNETYFTSNPLRPGVLATEGVADDVLLSVAADGTFQGDFNGSAIPAGKDWLFRYLDSELFPATTYGNTSTTTSFFPQPKDVGIAVTVWLGIEDDSAKGFWARKSWERLPFRLSR